MTIIMTMVMIGMTTLMLKTKLINSRHLRKLLLKGLVEDKLTFTQWATMVRTTTMAVTEAVMMTGLMSMICGQNDYGIDQ